MRSFSLFLALRYLKPKRTFVSVITLISILGVTLGIGVLILVISVMTGFDNELRKAVLGFEPHITISSEQPVADWRSLMEKIKATPHVVAAAPFVQGPVIAEFQGRVLTPVVRGIDPKAEQTIIDLKSFIKEGQLDLGSETAVIGSALADTFGIRVGDKLTIYAPGNIRGILDELKKEDSEPGKTKTLAELRGEIVMPADLTITGIFESGRYQYDSNIILVALHVGQELYSLQDRVHGISIKTTDPYQAEEVKRGLNHELVPPAYAMTWIDQNRDRFGAIAVERNVMFFILMFIIIVAAFGIMSTLITVTVQKTREIGVMKALGATTGQIVWVFLAQGMFVGFMGNVSGVCLALLAVHYRNGFKEWLANTLHIELFPPTIYEFTKIPAEVVPRDVAVICISAFFICSLAALIPAWFAARLDPVKALRYE
jgi:lipoprotein-releasing system permease protein